MYTTRFRGTDHGLLHNVVRQLLRVQLLQVIVKAVNIVHVDALGLVAERRASTLTGCIHLCRLINLRDPSSC